jgi:hypothetical protein
MKWSEVIRRQIPVTKAYYRFRGRIYTCRLCRQTRIRNIGCFDCPAYIFSSEFGYRDCDIWAGAIFDNNEEALRLAYEMALACEMQDD